MGHTDIDTSLDAASTDELLGSICHDLKEPLASIVMGSSFLIRELPEEARADRARRMAEAIHRAAHRMNRLLTDYHELSRLERGLASLDLGAHDAAMLFAAAAEPFREAAREAEVELRIDGGAVRAWCDRARVIDALQKLVSNALRATPRGGSITLQAQRGDGAALLAVADTGTGVPDAVLPHLFDYRWLATRRGRSGAGIGLALARRIVEAHGGELRVETAEGRGARFTMELPLR